MLWENKKYWVMYKYVWTTEFSLEDLPNISLKTPLIQTKNTLKFIWKWIGRIKNFIFNKWKKINSTKNKTREYRNISEINRNNQFVKRRIETENTQINEENS